MSEFQKFCIAFLVICGVILAVGFSFKIGRKVGYNNGYEEALNLPHKADTVWKTDTFTYEKPVEKIKWKDKLVYVPVTDSILIHHHDTTYVALQFEKVEYSDSTYRAIVSGYEPKLESISVFPKTAYITNTIVTRRHWGASVTAGPAVVFNGTWHGGLGAAIGLSYSF